MQHGNGQSGGLGDTPTASLAAAVAASEDGVAAIPIAAALGEEGVLLAVLDIREAFANERAYRPDLRLAFIPGADLDRPQVAAVALCWTSDCETPGVVIDTGAPIFGASEQDEL